MHTHHPASPISFGAEPRPLFGWFHPPWPPAQRRGVVVCNPIGDDAVRSHRVLRHLAERLQRAGFAVLRFDFDGTGDSAGDERDPDRVGTWLGDVGRAVERLRSETGVARVSLVGLRLGATLAAAAAAARDDIDAVILWRPYPSGGAFVDDVTRLHEVHRRLEPAGFALPAPVGWDAGGREALGFVLTTPTIAALERIDLSKLTTAPARRALVVGSGAASETRVATALRALGCAVDEARADDRFLVTIAHKATLPASDLDAMVAWLAAPVAVDDAPTATRAPAPRADLDGGREAPLSFAGVGPLFGILAAPARCDRERPAVVLVNAGTVHRIGPHRMYVRLARRLADAGFFVLRMDLSGIGDSPAPPGAVENLCYPRDAVADVRAGMHALTARLGARRFALVGLCSGGDIALQTALVDERVHAVVIMNPRTFGLDDLGLVESYQRPRYYAEALTDGRRLGRLCRGEVDVRRAVRGLAENLARLVDRHRAARAAAADGSDPPTSLGRLVARGVDTALIVAEHDPGVSYSDHLFPRGMRALVRLSGFRRIDLPGTDHTFTSVWAQAHVNELVVRHLAERYA
jgi:alpha-beta hydrolase superfamily lysophospholipase